MHVAAIEHIVNFADASGVNSVFPTALLEVFGEAARSGRGGDEIAAAVETFRRPG